MNNTITLNIKYAQIISIGFIIISFLIGGFFFIEDRNDKCQDDIKKFVEERMTNIEKDVESMNRKVDLESTLIKNLNTKVIEIQNSKHYTNLEISKNILILQEAIEIHKKSLISITQEIEKYH
jgi:hypothetical protein